jgi:hypothetical protein
MRNGKRSPHAILETPSPLSKGRARGIQRTRRADNHLHREIIATRFASNEFQMPLCGGSQDQLIKLQSSCIQRAHPGRVESTTLLRDDCAASLRIHDANALNGAANEIFGRSSYRFGIRQS